MYDYISGADVLDWRAMAQGFEQIGATGRTSRRVLRLETAQSVSVMPVTSNLFSTLGWPLVAGRPLEAGDERGGAVALLSERGWRRLFGASPAAVGRTVTLDAQPVTIVGVLKGIEGMAFSSDLYVVIDPQSAEFRDRQSRGTTNVI